MRMTIDFAAIALVADEARDSLGKFCLEECKGYCCRKGYLAITESNVNTVSQGHKAEFLENGKLKLMSPGNYSLAICNDCPSLDTSNFHCLIYKDELRPKVCADFPIIVNGNMVIFSSRCLAVRENKLFGYMKELEILGCKIVECDSFVDIIVNMPDSVVDEK